MKRSNRTLTVLGIAIVIFLMTPILVVVPMSFSSARSLTFPPPGLSLRWYSSFFHSDEWIESLGVSLVLAALSSTFAIILGSLAAYGLRRRVFRLKAAVESNFMAPIALPSIIMAVALYIAYARVGMLGSFTGLVIAHTLHGVPYVILVMSVAIRTFDIRLEQVSWTMGASWIHTMRLVVLPLLAPSLAAAWIFAFVASFDEVVISSFLSGTHDTLPKKMFNQLTLEISPTITAIASMLIAFTVLALAASGLFLRQRNKALSHSGSAEPH